MLKNYFKVAFRNLFRQKVLAAINILGLSVGLACFSLFLLYVINEFSYDRFHQNADRIYRVVRWNNGVYGAAPSGSTHLPAPLGPALKADLPEVEQFVRIREAWNDEFVRIDDKVSRKGVVFADAKLFDVFDFELKYGNPAELFKDPGSVVLTESTAMELFSESNPVGRTLEIKLEDDFQAFRVSGIAKDLPPNSSIEFGILASFDYLLHHTKAGERYENVWRRSSFLTFVQLREGSGLPDDANRLLKFWETYHPETESYLRENGYWTAEGPPITYKLQPLKEVHTDLAMSGATDPQNSWILLLIAAGVLLIAGINFTTLAIGRSAGRAKEVGVRKVIGGTRQQLVRQFLAEAVLLAVFSGGLAFILMHLALPYFNELSGKELSFSWTAYPELGWLLAGLVILVGLLAGSYPALVLSAFRPIEVLKSKVRLNGSNLFTRSLVTSQFVLSIGLIASTLIILDQVQYLQSKNPGFDKEQVVMVDASGTDTGAAYKRFKAALEGRPEIKGVAASELALGADSGWSRSGWEYNGEQKEAYEYFVTTNYIELMGMELLAGRTFKNDQVVDTINSVIVNEAFLNEFGWTPETAIGQELSGYFSGEERAQPQVIGVVKNFHFRPFSETVEPQLFHQFSDYTPFQFFVRIQPNKTQEALQQLQETWATIAPGFPIQYTFLDENLDRFYRSEVRFSRILAWAGGISIFLACLGLFGLAALAAVNRTREISIRKVLGASMLGITRLLSYDFLRLVFIAVFIAIPLVWYFMNDWLNDFAYRIAFPWWHFAIAGAVAALVALLTVGFQSLKAALANPAETLKTE